jgi:hypothetical protein
LDAPSAKSHRNFRAPLHRQLQSDSVIACAVRTWQ